MLVRLCLRKIDAKTVQHHLSTPTLRQNQRTETSRPQKTPSKGGTCALLSTFWYLIPSKAQMFQLQHNSKDSNKPAQLTGACRSTDRLVQNQVRLLSTSCISWHNMSRAMWQLKATFATSQPLLSPEASAVDLISFLLQGKRNG